METRRLWLALREGKLINAFGFIDW